MAIQPETRVDAAFEHAVDDEVESVQVLKLEAGNRGNRPVGELRVHDVAGELRSEELISVGAVCNYRDVAGIALIPRARMGDLTN
jgi:hypothetical protein